MPPSYRRGFERVRGGRSWSEQAEARHVGSGWSELAWASASKSGRGERSGSFVRVLRVLEALGGSFVRVLRVREAPGGPTSNGPMRPGGSAKEGPHACGGRGGGEGRVGRERSSWIWAEIWAEWMWDHMRSELDLSLDLSWAEWMWDHLRSYEFKSDHLRSFEFNSRALTTHDQRWVGG